MELLLFDLSFPWIPPPHLIDILLTKSSVSMNSLSPVFCFVLFGQQSAIVVKHCSCPRWSSWSKQESGQKFKRKNCGIRCPWGLWKVSRNTGEPDVCIHGSSSLHAHERTEKAMISCCGCLGALHKQVLRARQSCKLSAGGVKAACPNMCTELLSKGWDTHWFKAYKEISVG